MQLLRSSRGLLVVGGVLAVVAFVLVVVVMNNNNKANTPVATAVPTADLGSPTATPYPTPVIGEVVALRDVPAQLKFDNMGLVNMYFKTQVFGSGVSPKVGTVNSVNDWVNSYTHVLSPTTGLFVGTIQMTQAIRKGSALTVDSYRVLPMAPTGSLAYSLDPGRVAETIQLPLLQSVNQQILPGDFVDILLTIRQHEVQSLQSNPQPSGGTNSTGAVESQQLIANAKVLATGLQVGTGVQTYTLGMSLQDALLLKYVKDTYGTVDIVLMSSDDVRNQTVQPKTHAIFPEYFSTPETVAKGTPQGNGVLNTFITPLPTPTQPKSTTK